MSRGGGAPTKRIGRSFLGPFFPLSRSDFFFLVPRVGKRRLSSLSSFLFSLSKAPRALAFFVSLPLVLFFRKKDLCGAIVAFLSLSLFSVLVFLSWKETNLSLSLSLFALG